MSILARILHLNIQSQFWTFCLRPALQKTNLGLHHKRKGLLSLGHINIKYNLMVPIARHCCPKQKEIPSLIFLLVVASSFAATSALTLSQYHRHTAHSRVQPIPICMGACFSYRYQFQETAPYRYRYPIPGMGIQSYRYLLSGMIPILTNYF